MKLITTKEQTLREGDIEAILRKVASKTGIDELRTDHGYADRIDWEYRGRAKQELYRLFQELDEAMPEPLFDLDKIPIATDSQKQAS